LFGLGFLLFLLSWCCSSNPGPHTC
jgi:hypothetical protein